MNIVVFAWRDLSNPEAGGAENYVTRVAEDLVEQGHSVTYLTSKHPDAPSLEEKNGITYQRMGSKFTIFLQLPLHFLFKLKGKTDFVIENYNVWPFLVPWLHKNSITIIHHLQQQEWETEFGEVLGPVLRDIARFLTKISYSGNHVVTVSKSSQEEILEHGINPSKLEIIYNGIDDYFFENDPPEKPSDKIYLVSLGRLKKHKRIDLALKLAAGAIHTHGIKNIHIDIMGQGDQDKPLKKLVADLDIKEYVTFHGFVDDDTRLALLQRSHLHFQLSPKEGWGITVVEAASQGVPTICFNVPGLRDSVKPSTGYIVAQESELQSTFLEALREVSTRSESYLSKLETAREWAARFSWKQILPQWRSLLAEATSEE